MLEFKFIKKGPTKILAIFRKNKAIGDIVETYIYGLTRTIDFHQPLSLSEIEEISEALKIFGMSPLK